jgi:leucyl aminopeptidase (aminopeptidase T)
VCIGVNPGIEAPTGDALVDQNVPGLHIGIGDPAARATGATWSAPTCFAACQAAARVLVDGDLVVDSGRVVLPSRRKMPAAARHSTPPPEG